MNTITPFLWFDGKAEQAAKLYVSTFPNSRIVGVSRYGEAGPGKKGSVMSVDFRLMGQGFVALNGGPAFTFTPAISFFVSCRTQREVDHYWRKLSRGGEESQCGWLKDRFGVSWQIVPAVLPRLLQSKDEAKAARVMQAMLTMRKLDIAALERAAAASGARRGAATRARRRPRA